MLVIEANPRASRTVPFVSKATGVPLAKVAARVMLGATLAELRDEGLLRPPAEGGHVAVKEAVLPFNRFPTVDTLLGPEMRSTGEVMGIDRSFGLAFVKSQAAAGNRLPETGTVFLSLADRDKEHGLVAAARFAELGFSIVATAGTAAALEERGIPVEAVVAKVGEAGGRRRGRAHLLGQGRPRGQHAARPRAACRRHAHPAGRDRPRGRVPHDRRGRAGRGRGHRREPHHRRAPCARCRSTTATASCGSGCERASEPHAESPSDRDRRPAVSTSVALELANPIVAASGTFGHGAEVLRLVRPGAARRGHREVARRVRVGGQPAPRLHAATGGGMLNSVGLQGPGVDAWIADDLPALRSASVPVIVSIWGRTVDDFARGRAAARAARGRVRGGRGERLLPERRGRVADVRPLARTRPRAVVAGVRAVGWTGRCSRSCRRTSDIVDVARAAVDAGADGLTLVNTVLGLVIDAEHRRPLLGGGSGGLSGAPIKPVALRVVHEVTRALPGAPIIGTGGVTHRARRGRDAARRRGAVGVGTATSTSPARCRILDELAAWCAVRDVDRVADLVGALQI